MISMTIQAITGTTSDPSTWRPSAVSGRRVELLLVNGIRCLLYTLYQQMFYKP